jgi:hypothetical protein
MGTPGPQVIGVDEISISKGHDYRIVVSDLGVQRRGKGPPSLPPPASTHSRGSP